MDWQCLLHNLTGYFVKISEPYFLYTFLYICYISQLKIKQKRPLSQPFLNLWYPLRIYLNYIERILFKFQIFRANRMEEDKIEKRDVN